LPHDGHSTYRLRSSDDRQVTEQRPAGRPDEPFAAGFKQGERRPLEVFAA
jgi:hypothetical protein